MVRLILLRGYPASGKSTVGKLLERLGAGQFVDHDYLLRVVQALSSGEEENAHAELRILELEIAEARLLERKTVIIARECSSAVSIMPYAALCERVGASLTVFRLDAAPRILRRRIRWPRLWPGSLKQSSFSEELLGRWITDHPLEPWYGEHIINADGSAKQIAQSILPKLH